MAIDPDAPVLGPRPHSQLLRYYILSSLLLGPFFFFALLPLWLRYRSLRYEFDDDGVTMSWGVLHRRQVSLAYARIQDIHLSSNVIERRLGLAKIEIQTASGSASAEMTIEGLLEYEAVRDYLYSQMRGIREEAASRSTGVEAARAEYPGAALDAAAVADLTAILRGVAEELRALRTGTEPPPTASAGMDDDG